MILWNKVTDSLPPIDQKDSWNKEHGVSERVLVAFISTSTNSKLIAFATYYHKSGHWVYEGYRGDAYVAIAWSEAQLPALPEFQDIINSDSYQDSHSKNFDSTDSAYANAVRSVLGDNDL